MKVKIFIVSLFASVFSNGSFAQDRTTVIATNSDISDNLDLRAVASIFGDANNLNDFEQKLNDPKMKISNLDLNGDNQVDYLRVIESVEGNTHLIIIQSVLERDVFQDVATVEIEKDRHNNVQIQVVGDVYMYGQNYIYEPVYYHQPVIYNSFWVNNYSPYFSSWYWGYYPTYFYAWNPYPIYTYCHNVNYYINGNHHYNYVNMRRSQRAVALHNRRHANGYEIQHPNRSFAQRNIRAANRHELNQIRTLDTGTPRSTYTATAPRVETPRSTFTNTVLIPVKTYHSASVMENAVDATTNVFGDTSDSQISSPFINNGIRTAQYTSTDTPRNGIRSATAQLSATTMSNQTPRASVGSVRNISPSRTIVQEPAIRQTPHRSYQRTETRQPGLTNRVNVIERNNITQRNHASEEASLRR